MNRLILLLNLAFAFLLIISQVAPRISPAKWWPLEVFALSYPFLLIINCCFFLYWALLKSRYAFISLVILLTGYDKISCLYQIPFFKIDLQIPPESIKVMSYNVRLFDLYNWSGNIKTRKQIMTLFSKEQPDVLCLQEYYHSDNVKQYFSNNDTICRLLNNCNAHIQYGVTLRQTDHWGVATFTKYPVIQKGTVFYNEGNLNIGIYTDVLYKKDTVRIYNVHLQSNHFKHKDYIFLENPDSGSNKQIAQNIKDIVGRISKAVSVRSTQVDILADHIKHCSYPYILCGDFNDPPFTYSYQSVANYSRDAFLDKGRGAGISYIGSFPPYRIDYIFHHKRFETIRWDMVRKKYSDHFPVLAWFRLLKKN